MSFSETTNAQFDVARTVRRLRMDLTFEEMARRLEVTTRTIYRYANRETQPEEMIRLRLFDLASEHGKLVHVVETP